MWWHNELSSELMVAGIWVSHLHPLFVIENDSSQPALPPPLLDGLEMVEESTSALAD
jgi:hypothetical protein